MTILPVVGFGPCQIQTPIRDVAQRLSQSIYFKNWPRLDHKNLCSREHKAWLRLHISNRGWNQALSGSRTRRGGHLVEYSQCIFVYKNDASIALSRPRNRTALRVRS